MTVRRWSEGADYSVTAEWPCAAYLVGSRRYASIDYRRPPTALEQAEYVVMRQWARFYADSRAKLLEGAWR